MWKLVIACILKVVKAKDLCEKVLDLNVSLVSKIEAFLTEIDHSGKVVNGCDKKYVRDFLTKRFDINYDVPHIIKAFNQTFYGDNIPQINSEAEVMFYPVRVFERKRQSSTSLWTIKSNFLEGHLNGEYFSPL